MAQEAEVQFDVFSATMAAEGEWDMAGVEVTQENYIAAYQYLIDNGVVWQLQGSFGRTARALINSGECHEAFPDDGHDSVLVHENSGDWGGE
jgi:hypothetical protein